MKTNNKKFLPRHFLMFRSLLVNYVFPIQSRLQRAQQPVYDAPEWPKKGHEYDQATLS